MKSNYLYLLLLVFLFSCERDVQVIDVYDGKQTLEFQLNIAPHQVLEGTDVPEIMSPKVYRIFLFKDNLYANTLTLGGEYSSEQMEAGYSYLAVGAEDESQIPTINLVEGKSTMNDVFLNLYNEEGNVSGVPNVVVSSGSFTMGSTFNTVKMNFRPLGCEYQIAYKKNPQHSIKKIKLVLKGGAKSCDFNLKTIYGDGIETLMKSENMDEDGWVDVSGNEVICSAKILLPNNPSLKLELSIKDKNDQVTVIDGVNVDLSMESGFYMADLIVADPLDNALLDYKSPLYPRVSVNKTDVVNEHELKLASLAFPEYKYQWRHERMGRTALLGISNGVFKYAENGIIEGASAIVSGAGKYILSIEKDGVVRDVASASVEHESMTWTEAMSKLEQLGNDWMIPNRSQMAELYSNDINDFDYDLSTDKLSAKCYWTSDEAGYNWAFVYFFNPYWHQEPTRAPEKSTIHEVRFLKIIPFKYDPTDPFSVGIMSSPEPYVGEQKLYITTPTYDGAIYQWTHERTARSQLSLDKNGKLSYNENGIPQRPEVNVTGAGKYVLMVTYAGKTREVGSVTVKHARLSWNDLSVRLQALNKNASGYTWKVPTLERLRQMFNNGNNDCMSGWYWSEDFVNTANRWKYLKDMGSGTEDAGDIQDNTKIYNIRFIKQSN